MEACVVDRNTHTGDWACKVDGCVVELDGRWRQCGEGADLRQTGRGSDSG